jgi:hypothetical protein
MSLWGNVDQANNAPKSTDAGGHGVSANGEVLFGNTQISAFITDAAVGVFGVDTTEQGLATSNKPAHAGWILRKAGTGPVVTITANTGSYSPDGNVYLTFTGGGEANTTANAQITTNSVSKLITGVVVNEGGSYLTAPIASAVNANAVFTITMGGRADRIQTETLVAMGSVSGDAEDDIYSNS